MSVMWKVRELADKVTNVVMNYTEIESKVREATTDDAWGPTGSLMQELASYTFCYDQFPELMGMLWKRMLQDNRRSWRRTYKSLILLNYLIKYGSERVITSAREHIYDLRSLENYAFIDEHGKDMGINIRHRAKALIELIQDDEKLRDERKKAKKSKDKYIGVSSGMINSSSSWSDSPRRNYDDFGDSPHRSSRSKDSLDYKDDDNNSESEEADTEPSTTKTSKTTTRTNVKNDLSGNKTTSTRNRIEPSRRIDLGEAANYAKNVAANGPSKKESNENKTNEASSKDLLEEIFSGISEPSKPEPKFDDFADFASFTQSSATAQASQSITDPSGRDAFGQQAPKDDDFADFASAFTTGSQAQGPSKLQSPPSNPFNLLNDDLTSSGNPFAEIPSVNIPTVGPSLSSNNPIVNQMASSAQMSPVTQLSSAFMAPMQPLVPTNMNMNLSKPDSLNLNTVSSTKGSQPFLNNSTWAGTNVDINIDNLFSSKYENKNNAPSMNQLAATMSSVNLNSPGSGNLPSNSPLKPTPTGASFGASSSTDFFNSLGNSSPNSGMATQNSSATVFSPISPNQPSFPLSNTTIQCPRPQLGSQNGTIR
ncbi:clathrin interactor lqfR [Brevipalpus obovatus]|uniref:clathrin interactor lqfR n=1 Tax=Brevipalpus obovatus TaxID=246614 RepID=UPI003D9E3941